MSCKPANYGYNRHRAAIDRESSIARSFFSGNSLLSFSINAIPSKARRDFLLFVSRHRQPPSFRENRLSAPGGSRSISFEARSIPPKGVRIAARYEEVFSEQDRPEARARARACERLKTLRGAIRYPRNYVYPSPLV